MQRDLFSQDNDKFNADKGAMRNLLETEIKVVMQMDHPNIVKFYQCVYDNRFVNIVMELARGIPLSDLIISRGKIAQAESQIIIRQVLHATKYFHSCNIVHRDLKLDNIMIIGSETKNINDLRVKLIDFGMSKHTKHGNKKIDLNTYCGTIHFMAPEVLEGKTYDQTCDIWSIGVIAYMCLAGMPPFKGKNDVAIHKAIITNDYDFDENIWS